MQLPAAPAEACLAVTLTNVAGEGGARAEHKLKLYTLTLS